MQNIPSHEFSFVNKHLENNANLAPTPMTTHSRCTSPLETETPKAFKFTIPRLSGAFRHIESTVKILKTDNSYLNEV